jgi:hypothetical protein
MQIVDHYLKAVQQLLPKEQQEDIVHELSENIRSQIEDKERELGRPLSEAELEALLKRHGRPAQVASCYWKDQRSLAFGRQWIGPTVFPFYEKILSLNVGLTALVLAVVAIVMSLNGKPLGSWEAIKVFFTHLSIQFAIVTLIFVGVEAAVAKGQDNWNPRSRTPMVKDRSRVSRLESVSEMIALLIFLSWLELARHSPHLILGNAARDIRLGPAWHQLYLTIVILGCVGFIQAAINLVRPDWVGFRSVVRLASGLAWIGVLCVNLSASDWIVLADPAQLLQNGNQRKIEIVNQSIFYSLVSIGVISVSLALYGLVRRQNDPARGQPPNNLPRNSATI